MSVKNDTPLAVDEMMEQGGIECEECEDSGFVFSSYQSVPGAPYLNECPSCGNPNGYLHP